MVLCLGILVASVSGGANSVSGQRAKAGQNSKEASSLALWSQAGSLVHYARDNESAVAMLAAVEIVRRLSFRDGKERFANKKSKGGEVGTKESKTIDLAPISDTRKLLAEAKAWAKGDKNLAELIDAEMKKPLPTGSGTLGRKGGPLYYWDKIDGRGSDSYSITYRAGEKAEILVVGDGSSDLDLFVYDKDGNLMARDINPTARGYARFAPTSDLDVSVEVRNVGTSRSTYEIWTE